MRGLVRAALALMLFVLMPGIVHAQATLSGTAKDTSGAVLPGVTVEASSPALIEKVRSAVTDSNGRYTIVDLRPGTYQVTFTLTGFTTVVREGVQLSGTSTFTTDAELRVGNLQETITVSGDAPTVNLQTTTRQAVMDQEIVSAIPSSRTPFTVGVLIPGVQRGAFMSQDVGGSVVQEVASLEANGGRTADQRMMVNGVALSSMIAGGWGGGAVPNATGTAEFAIDVSGVDAQAATGGVRINFIPRDGGNRFSGTVAASLATEGFGGDNLKGTDLLQQYPTLTLGRIKGNGDFNPGFGGPLRRDRLWFFLSGRSLFADNYVANMFFNENANRLDRFDYVRSTRQAILHQEQKIGQARVTWQINQKNKLGVTADFESFCACATGVSATTSPEAGADRRFPLQRFVTTDWNTPISSKLLVEASAIHRVERWGGMHPRTGKLGNVDGLTPGIISVTDSANPVTGGGLTYRSAAQFNNSWNWNLHYRAAVSYITGSHNFKVGFNNAYGHHDNTTYSDPALPYSFNAAGGVPSQIVYRIVPRTVAVVVNRDLGLFVQDKWTTGRLTLSGGLRFDSFKSGFPAQSIAGTFFGRTLSVSYPELENLSWNDVTPKLSAAYDLFGNGRTALKVTVNKYLEGLGTTGGFGNDNVSDSPNPVARLLNQTTRPWADANRNWTPDCNLNNFAANGECGDLANAAIFGTVIPGTTYDPELLTGWGKRGFNWEFTTAVQHEIMPRLGVEVQYARRWYGNFRVADDTGVTAADYDRFTIPVPTDSRLPNSGGRVTLLDPTAAAAARPQTLFVTEADNFGKKTEHFDGVNITVNARLQNGLIVQGGLGTGRVVADDCDIVDDLPEQLHQFFGGNQRGNFFFAARPLERCHENRGLRTRVQGLGAYTIPKIDVQISATLQNLPGAEVAANANVSSIPVPGWVVVALPRPLSGGAPFRVLNLLEPGAVFVERLNQIDFRASKLFRYGSTRTSLNFDFYNITNSNSVVGENFNYAPLPSPDWRRPQTILLPRMFKISAQFDF